MVNPKTTTGMVSVSADNVWTVTIESLPSSVKVYWHPVADDLSMGMDSSNINPNKKNEGDGGVRSSHLPTVERWESVSGKAMLRYIIHDLMERSDAEIVTLKNEKPVVRLPLDSQVELSVSFSHTANQVVAVVSEDFVVGVDIERADRRVGERIVRRMKHPEESEGMLELFPPIQVWTMKEAALKAIGTGLREPMNSVCLLEMESGQDWVDEGSGSESSSGTGAETGAETGSGSGSGSESRSGTGSGTGTCEFGVMQDGVDPDRWKPPCDCVLGVELPGGRQGTVVSFRYKELVISVCYYSSDRQ